MSGTDSSAGGSQQRTDTMIGAGLRIDGHVVFTGVLRIQGEVVGDVACQGDTGDTVVVDATGSVTGAVGAPRIVVKGRVLGPLHSAQSIDIRPGGSVVGDAFYKQLVIHAGGFIEGALMPALPVGAAREVYAGQVPAADAPDLPPAVEAAAQDAAPPPAVPAAEPAPSPAPAAGAFAPPASAPPPAEGAEETVTVQGVNPAKPAGAFLLISREPSVLYRKRREEAGEGTRFVVPKGRTVSVAIGRHELFRVAEGRDLEIFYQGRKVAPKTIESGAWMRFVPQGGRATGEERQAETEGAAAR